jgi:hypothetical protein
MRSELFRFYGDFCRGKFVDETLDLTFTIKSTNLLECVMMIVAAARGRAARRGG